MKHNIPEGILNLELYYKTTNCQRFLMERSMARDNKRCPGAQIQTVIYFVCSNTYTVFYLVGCLISKMFRQNISPQTLVYSLLVQWIMLLVIQILLYENATWYYNVILVGLKCMDKRKMYIHTYI